MNRKVRLTAAGIVFAAVATISYGHIASVAQHFGNSAFQAHLYPVFIDGAILASGITLAASVGVSKVTRLYASLTRWAGFLATVAFNVAASDFTSTGAALVNLAPGVFMIVTTEMIIHSVKGTPASRGRTIGFT